MNPVLRLGPYLYSALHSYEMAWELLLLGSERRHAERDAALLRRRFPFLDDYAHQSAACLRQLAPAYAEYTAAVSPAPIAIARPLAVFLAALCRQTRPRRVLDLGSGFSSYVFRAYQRDSRDDPRPLVYSVDEAPPWLARTRAFLERHALDCQDLATWDQLTSTSTQLPGFDLILQDFGTLAVRLRMLDQVIAACRPGGMIVVDDMHVPGYRRAVLRELDRRGLSYFSLRSFTRKRLRYAYLILR